MRVIGYVRGLTEKPAVSGAGLQAQRRAIVAECMQRGWELVETIEDAGYSANDVKRPGVQEALRALEAGEEGACGREARSPLALAARLRRVDGDGAEAELGVGRARLRRRHVDARRRGDGARPRDVRPV